MPILDTLRDLVRRYPARSVSLTVSAIVFMAARFGAVLPELSVLHAVEIVLPILVGGEATHRRVTPV